jgi:hypothetical protein
VEECKINLPRDGGGIKADVLWMVEFLLLLLIVVVITPTTRVRMLIILFVEGGS